MSSISWLIAGMQFEMLHKVVEQVIIPTMKLN